MKVELPVHEDKDGWVLHDLFISIVVLATVFIQHFIGSTLCGPSALRSKCWDIAQA